MTKVVLCGRVFNENTLEDIGKTLGILVGSIVLCLLATYTLWIPLSKSGENQFQKADSCSAAYTDLRCRDNFKFECNVFAELVISGFNETTFIKYPDQGVISYGDAKSVEKKLNKEPSCWFKKTDPTDVRIDDPEPNITISKWIGGIVCTLTSLVLLVLSIAIGVTAFKYRDHMDEEPGIFKIVKEEYNGGLYMKERAERMVFIRKVYAIMSGQLIVTVGVVAMCLFIEDLNLFLQEQWWVMIFAFVFMFGGIFMLFAFKKSAWKGVALVLFTLASSLVMGIICLHYALASILNAMVLTSTIFVTLTLFTFQTKVDFSFMGAGLFAFLWIMIGAGILQIFWPTHKVVQLIISTACVILFALFILYDTSMIMRKYSTGDYIAAAINLYLDFIIMFTHLLRLIGMMNK